MVKYVNASEEAAYTVNAYYDEHGRDLSKSADCDDYGKAVELAHEFIGDSGSVEIINNKTGAYKLYTYDEYFEDFEGESPFSYVSDVLASTRKVEASDNYSNEANINRRKIMDNKKVLVETFEETRDDGPKVCADKLIEKLGVADAKEIIAYMAIAHGDWDARIDDRVYAWATTICPYDEESVNGAHIYYCDDIHPANFDMIAKYIMRSE